MVYWMTSARRTSSNFGLQHALGQARSLRRPLLILEALRLDYPWSSYRMHRFVLDGMLDQLEACRAAGVTYYPYVEREVGAGKGLLEALAKQACLIVTDAFPCFFLPKMIRTVAARLPVRLETVDSNGILPLVRSGKTYLRAVDYRRSMQRELLQDWPEFPMGRPLEAAMGMDKASIPPSVLAQWPAATATELPLQNPWIDLAYRHQVEATSLAGGSKAALRTLHRFLENTLRDYGEARVEPEPVSGLSPYLHFGQIGAHEILAAAVARENWDRSRLGTTVRGQREGWWDMTAPMEAFLDQLLVWRELGFHFCHREPDFESFESLPAWARESLELHAQDPRPYTYTLEQFDRSLTHDPLWNAAQRQLRESGSMHGYLRMLWGKKILHWSASPEEALATMIELNNRYALDGRDPNSYSGIFWTLGRFDRAWGPERPVFGKVRYMTSDSTLKKRGLKEYLARWEEGVIR